MTPNARFTELLQDIEPSPTTGVRAIRAHTAMRDFLCSHETFTQFHISVAARKHKRSGLQTRKLLAQINCK